MSLASDTNRPRIMLRSDGSIPSHGAGFLDQAVEIVFLRLVAGGYMLTYQLVDDACRWHGEWRMFHHDTHLAPSPPCSHLPDRPWRRSTQELPGCDKIPIMRLASCRSCVSNPSLNQP
jgi:hypothetical protein